MLSQFSVKNFKSIKNWVTLDMQAVSISEHKNSLIKDNDELFIPASVIYGPNGGGKSNILEAIKVLQYKIITPILATKNQDLYATALFNNYSYKPFAFDDTSKNNPVETEIFFRTKFAEYRYKLAFNQDEILSESLDMIKFSTKRQSALFSRDNNAVSIFNALKNIKLNTDISSDLPFLSYLALNIMNNETVSDVINFFLQELICYDLVAYYNKESFNVFENEKVKKLLLQLFKKVDIDINNYRLEKSGNFVEVYTEHLLNSKKHELNMKDESSGTQKIFKLLPVVISSLNTGKTLVVDELDAKLHPKLLKYIIQMFTDRQINKNGAQLIFTSHDLSTMNNDVFRRDEIWFIAKGNNQDSQLYSLVELKDDKGNKIRKDELYSRQYLKGKYGADPYLQKIVSWDYND